MLCGAVSGSRLLRTDDLCSAVSAGADRDSRDAVGHLMGLAKLRLVESARGAPPCPGYMRLVGGGRGAAGIGCDVDRRGAGWSDAEARGHMDRRACSGRMTGPRWHCHHGSQRSALLREAKLGPGKSIRLCCKGGPALGAEHPNLDQEFPVMRGVFVHERPGESVYHG